MKKIDAHAHIVEYINGWGSRGELRALGNGMVEYADGKKFQIFPSYLGDKSFTYERLLEIMDENEVEKAVLLQGNYLGFQNLYVAEAVSKYPNRFIGACSIDPFCKERDSIAKHLFEDLSFKIIKMEVSNTSGLMANHNTIDLFGIEMKFIYDLCRKYKAILTIDIGRPSNPCYQVERLKEAIINYPDVTFVVCHLGSHQSKQSDLFIKDINMLNFPNVYFDIASLPNNTKEEYPYKEACSYLKLAKEIVGANRLMFGSDIPAALAKASYQEFVNYLIDSGVFTDKELEDVFYNTANRVYFKQN